MITPGTQDLWIPAGSVFSITLQLTTAAGAALPLTAYLPFTAAAGKAPGRDPEATFTVANSDAD